MKRTGNPQGPGTIWRRLRLFVPAVLILFLAPIDPARAGDWASAQFALGNAAYERGDYDSAAVCYNRITLNGIENAAVYYNLANTCFRKNKLGLAILYYEKAARLEPNDLDIQANLRFARSQLVDKIPEPELGFAGMILRTLHSLLSLRASTWLVFVLYLLLAATITFGVFAGFSGRQAAVYVGSVVLTLLLATGIDLAFKIHHHEQVKYAVLLAHSVNAVNEPEGTQTLFTAHEGTKFRIRKSLDQWVLVTLPNGLAGWIPARDLGKI